ncbi:MAG TPA: DUF2007 domain-containing protein [Castellaniella sp.]|uniref:putative signal transducing protein n=1 Tax=Castellaniella sp. TaxID=1955812 RepID=UPI002EE7F460
MTLIAVYRPKSNSEALVIEALMQAHHIAHVMQGGAFSSMYPGALRTSLNAQTLLVEEEQVALAKALLVDFLDEDEAIP